MIKSYLLASQQVIGHLLLQPPFLIGQIRGEWWVQWYLRLSANIPQAPIPPLGLHPDRDWRAGVPDQSLGHLIVFLPRLTMEIIGNVVSLFNRLKITLATRDLWPRSLVRLEGEFMIFWTIPSLPGGQRIVRFISKMSEEESTNLSKLGLTNTVR